MGPARIGRERPSCYPPPPDSLLAAETETRDDRLPLLDVLTSPVPVGVFDSPTDRRHVLCLHLGAPVPVSYRAAHAERQGVRLHGQFCVVPATTSTRWVLSAPARSLLLRLAPRLLAETAEAMGVRAEDRDLAPAIHVRDAQIERIGWLMQSEERDGHPAGRLFSDGLATALAARLVALQTRREPRTRRRALAPRLLRRVIEFVESHLDEDLTLAQLAGVAGLGVSHFKPLFREAAGMPPHRFVLQRRVERARVRLLERDGTRTEIALDCGFSHASHMARVMRRILGAVPSEIAPMGRLDRSSAKSVS
jgi:AraC family transcriptional regulator